MTSDKENNEYEETNSHLRFHRSIGTQALQVIEEHSDLYEVYCLTANNRVKELAEQARKFRPAAVVIANEAHYDELKAMLSDVPEVKVYAGTRAIDEIVEADPIDMVLTAMVGFAGLSPTIHALRRRRRYALPTKKLWLLPENSSQDWQWRTMLRYFPSTASTLRYSRALWARATTPSKRYCLLPQEVLSD